MRRTMSNNQMMVQQQQQQQQQRPRKTRLNAIGQHQQQQTRDIVDFLKRAFLTEQANVVLLRETLSNPNVPFTFHNLDDLSVQVQNADEYADELLESAVTLLHSMNKQNTQAGRAFIKKLVEKFFRPQSGRMFYWNRAINKLYTAMRVHGYTLYTVDKIKKSISQFKQSALKNQKQREQVLRRHGL